MAGLFDTYPRAEGDEAVDPSGRPRAGWAALAAGLDAAGLAAAAAALAAERARRGAVAGEWVDGRQEVRPVPQDPLPRLLPAAEWTALAAGVEQRHRALNAFLSDVYRAAGRRRGDPDRAPELVRAGVLPEWAVAHHPSRDPDAVGLAWPGQPRAALAAADAVRTPGGEWLVLGDDLRVPAGLGWALAARDAGRAALPGPEAASGAASGAADPRTAVPLLRGALRAAAPSGCGGEPVAAVLSVGETDGAWFEHRLLAEALGVPVVRPADLWPRPDGGVAALRDGERWPVDVLYRRVGDAELAVHRGAGRQPLSAMFAEAVRAGRLGLVNVPGNGVADDEATYPWVPAMIRFYLGEEPLLRSVRTWVLADDAQWAEVRHRLHELVVRPVGGYGGGGAVVGPECSADELAQLHAEVAAAPHRFVVQEPVTAATVPSLVDGQVLPRPAELRVFSVAGERTRALPAPLTRLQGTSITKDTWLLP